MAVGRPFRFSSSHAWFLLANTTMAYFHSRSVTAVDTKIKERLNAHIHFKFFSVRSRRDG